VRSANLFHTSSFRLTLVYAALFSVGALILFGVMYWATSFYMTNELDADIQSDITELKQGLAVGGRDNLVRMIEARVGQMPSGPIAYRLDGRDGTVVVGNLPPTAQTASAFNIEAASLASSVNPRGAFHIHRVPLDTGDYLLVGGDSHQLIEMRALILHTFGWCFAITMLLALGGGALISASLLRRVEAVGRTSREIMEGNLSRRIPMRGVDDEFDRLAASLNAMLDRTESSLEGLRQVSNDIAHDLRTPLARLRQRLELTQRKAQSIEEFRAAIDRSIADTDAILDTFSALLRIAQLEGQASKARFRTVDLSELLLTVAEVYQPTAEERCQQLVLAISSGLMVFGDPQLLTQLFANLVENAIRHSPIGASVTLGAARRNGAVEAIVADTGPGIPEAAREKVFRRFYRLEASRTTPGQGLGLSLVAAIASLHQIEIKLGDNGPGLHVRLGFMADRGLGVGKAGLWANLSEKHNFLSGLPVER
jgi:signal transduction histidine kinase